MSLESELTVNYTCDGCTTTHKLNYQIASRAEAPKIPSVPTGWIQIRSDIYYDEHYCPDCTRLMTGRRER